MTAQGNIVLGRVRVKVDQQATCFCTAETCMTWTSMPDKCCQMLTPCVQDAHREELGVAVDAGEALPHHPRLPQVPLVRHQQVQRPVLVLCQRACGVRMLLDSGLLPCLATVSSAALHPILLPGIAAAAEMQHQSVP